ncbi:MAG: carbamoyltransferase HypF [Candidatus Altiarchaeota archaeon]
MYRFTVRGVVQGVGFRPYIYRKARERGLVGYVKNAGGCVEIVVDDRDFIGRLTDLPPLARITEHSVGSYGGGETFRGFTIRGSSPSEGQTQMPPDIFMCGDCLRELRDPGDRRHGYYFITCTNCGPRFSMTYDSPYDRPNTAMGEFRMCQSCRREYEDPADRRYHAQTIACGDCGPRLLLKKGRRDISCGTDRETIRKAVDVIRSGQPVAIKGVGGFHMCSLTDDKNVKMVRKALGRPNKPFAIMVRDLDMLKETARFSPYEAELIAGPQRPILVLAKKNQSDFGLVSELDTIGVMLPYTALHYLLFDCLDEPLLMTSCNIPGEPVAVSERLAEYYLTHERRIVNRCDDSVLKSVGGSALYLRRSRGYAPLSVPLPIVVEDTIALGAESNNAVLAAKGRECSLSQHIGECSKLETFEFMKEAVRNLVRLGGLKPGIVACDMHPGYNSTAYALELADEFDARLVRVQHHKAHVASVAAEHGFTGYVGIAMDGMGYGEDGTVWGGEVFDVEGGGDFTRIGSLQEQPQLGGDFAVLHPRRMLFGILAGILDERELAMLKLFNGKDSRLYRNLLDSRFNTPMTSSAGRILDAVAALLRVCDDRTYDGRPAMMLEGVASKPLRLEPVVERLDGREVLSTDALFRFLLENRGLKTGNLAATAQMYLAQGLYSIASEAAERGCKPIVLSGGVAYNRMITGYMLGRGVSINRDIPCGDGGICYGQAYLANVRGQ